MMLQREHRLGVLPSQLQSPYFAELRLSARPTASVHGSVPRAPASSPSQDSQHLNQESNMVHLTWRFVAAAAVSIGFGVKVLRKRHTRNQPRLSPEEIRATAGFVAEQRQRQHEERQRRRAPRRNKGWTTPGNAGCTLITKGFARQLGLVDFDGNPTQAYLSRTRVQGVVAGAYDMLRRINIQYEIKGKRVRCVAGLTEARLGCDLLVSRREIVEFESDGYTFSAR